jgi:hypothetical protein
MLSCPKSTPILREGRSTALRALVSTSPANRRQGAKGEEGVKSAMCNKIQ